MGLGPFLQCVGSWRRWQQLCLSFYQPWIGAAALQVKGILQGKPVSPVLAESGGCLLGSEKVAVVILFC